MDEYNILTWDEWVEKFKPIRNQFGEVREFEAYGKDYEYLMAQNPACIWTYGHSDEGFYIGQGLRFVNRLAYYVTEVPFDEWCEVHFDDGLDEDEEEEKE